MNELKKPIWHEGTLLTQQHFQSWDNYLQNQLFLLMRNVNSCYWGFDFVHIDESALLNGVLRITKCCVIYQNGLMVTFDSDQDGELCYSLKHQEKQSIYLCLSLDNNINELPGYENKNHSTWRTDYEIIHDQYDAERKREVGFAKPNLILLNEESDRQKYAVIKICEVYENGDRTFYLNNQYILSVTHIGSSQRLAEIVSDLVELVTSKITLLDERKGNYSNEFINFGSIEILHFLLLKELSQSLPLLRGYLRARNTHPYIVYQEMVRLLASIEVLLINSEKQQIIFYDHNNLTEVFCTLEKNLISAINQVLPSNLVKIKLTKESDQILIAEHLDYKILKLSDIYIAVNIENAKLEWKDYFTRKIKLADKETIYQIIASAVPAVEINHLQRPPNHLPVQNGYEYFQVKKQGAYWNKIIERNNLAIFLPEELAQAYIEMIAIKE